MVPHTVFSAFLVLSFELEVLRDIWFVVVVSPQDSCRILNAQNNDIAFCS